ncbi:putative fatty acid repression mutant protein [Cercophora scortea]|uniref:Fatty acid repression mutant protein n=1 Tax=Cercophora scortea TaxID=314031 RepID=A0AAE0IGX4_9PEZI|nr:putative fatty acid repression mutant protein [Cercophora scortea]
MSTSAPSLSASEAFKARRSVYALSDEDLPITDARVQEIINRAILHTPSPFNSQDGRAVLLVKDEHKKFWDIAYDVAKATASPEIFEKLYVGRLKMFRAAYGTVLFYSDPAPLKALEAKWPMIQDKFAQWADQENGMLQYAVWTMLSAEGLGCSLQHYNPSVDSRVGAEWNIPAEWNLQAQLVFGKPVAPAREKTFEPLEGRVFVHGA